MTADDSSEAKTDADAVGTSFDTGHDQLQVPFKVWTNYGATGDPRYYVCLDAGEHGEHSWWFDPDQAEALGRKLQEYGALTRRQNEEEEERLRRVAAERENPPDP